MSTVVGSLKRTRRPSVEMPGPTKPPSTKTVVLTEPGIQTASVTHNYFAIATGGSAHLRVSRSSDSCISNRVPALIGHIHSSGTSIATDNTFGLLSSEVGMRYEGLIRIWCFLLRSCWVANVCHYRTNRSLCREDNEDGFYALYYAIGSRYQRYWSSGTALVRPEVLSCLRLTCIQRLSRATREANASGAKLWTTTILRHWVLTIERHYEVLLSVRAIRLQLN